MGERSESAVLLDSAMAGFVTGPVSMLVASCDANCVPSLTRAYGCRVAADRCSLGLFLPAARAAAVLADLRARRQLAAVFTRPSTHQTLQLKAAEGRIGPLAVGDRECMLRYAEMFAAEIALIGFPAEFSRVLMAATLEDAVCLTFTPQQAFDQTPGPDAGRRLGAQP